MTLVVLSHEGVYLEDSTALVKRAVDIVALVGEYLSLNRMGGKFKGLCPFHEDHTPSLIVDPNFQSFKCWACGAGGDVFSFLQRIERIDFVEAKQRLAERAGIQLKQVSREVLDARQMQLSALAWAAERFHDWLKNPSIGEPARAYLQERGFTEETIQKYQLGYSLPAFDGLLQLARRAQIGVDTLHAAGLLRKTADGRFYDAFRGRLMFPIRDERRRVLGFGARILPGSTDAEAGKYLNSSSNEIYQKSEVLYGLDVARTALLAAKSGTPRQLVLMEGYTDCLMAYQHGFHFAFATCGTALTPKHIRKIRQYADQIVVMYDGDGAGQKAARRSLELFLEAELEVRFAILPAGQDPADLIRQKGIEGLEQVLAQSVDAIQFAIRAIRGEHDQNSLQGRLAAQDELLAMLASIPIEADTKQRMRFDVAVSELVSGLGTNERTLRERIDELRRNKARALAPKPANLAKPQDAARPDRRERQVVQWLVARPGKSVPVFRENLELAGLKSPSLRQLAEAAYHLYSDVGETATFDELRERVNDPDLDAMLVNMVAELPTEDERFAEGLAEVARSLAEQKAKAAALALRGELTEQHGGDDHVEKVRQLGRPSAR